jgi:hypothetical protein
MRIKAKELTAGLVCRSGEVITNVGRCFYDHCNKLQVPVTLELDGRTRTAHWGGDSTIFVKEPAKTWGIEVIPVADRIAPDKTYKTRSGHKVIGIDLKLYNSAGREVTFPIKGSIIRKGRQPRYNIWTLNGLSHLNKVSPDDLIEVTNE